MGASASKALTHTFMLHFLYTAPKSDAAVCLSVCCFTLLYLGRYFWRKYRYIILCILFSQLSVFIHIYIYTSHLSNTIKHNQVLTYDRQKSHHPPTLSPNINAKSSLLLPLCYHFPTVPSPSSPSPETTDYHCTTGIVEHSCRLYLRCMKYSGLLHYSRIKVWFEKQSHIFFQFFSPRCLQVYLGPRYVSCRHALWYMTCLWQRHCARLDDMGIVILGHRVVVTFLGSRATNVRSHSDCHP